MHNTLVILPPRHLKGECSLARQDSDYKGGYNVCRGVLAAILTGNEGVYFSQLVQRICENLRCGAKTVDLRLHKLYSLSCEWRESLSGRVRSDTGDLVLYRADCTQNEII